MSAGHVSFVSPRKLAQRPDPRVWSRSNQFESDDGEGELREDMMRALSCLVRSERRMIRLCYGGTYSVEEAAKQLGMTPERAKHLQENALNKLRVYLSPAISD